MSVSDKINNSTKMSNSSKIDNPTESKTEIENHLLVFYGTECPHCDKMFKLVERLEKENNLKIQRIEIWHNEENTRLMENYDKDNCGGVPFFYNTKTKAWLCGEVEYQELLDWVK